MKPILIAQTELIDDATDEDLERDIALALETARELDAPMPSARAVDRALNVALGFGYGRRDIAALFTMLNQLTGDQARSPA